MFRLSQLKDEKLRNSSARIVLYLVCEKSYLDKTNTVQMSQTYLADNGGLSRQTVIKELKYLQSEGYITYQRSLIKVGFQNLTTTAITLQEKAIAIISNYTNICKSHSQKKEASNIVSEEITNETTPNDSAAIAEEEELSEAELQAIYDGLTEYQKELCYQLQIADDKEEPYVNAVLRDVPIELANELEQNKFHIANEK